MPVVKMPDGALVELPDNPTPEMLAQMAPESPELARVKETGRVVDKSVRKGLASMPGLIGDAALATMRSARDNADKLPIPTIFSLPGMIDKIADPQKQSPVHATKFGDVTTALETAGGLAPPVSEPKTPTGKSAANIGESVVSAASGGGPKQLVQRALMGLAGGVGGEAGAKLTGDSPIGRVLGAILGGGAWGVGSAWKSNSDEIAGNAVKHMKPEDWAKAKELEATLKANNIPHLKSQLLGDRSTLADTIAVAGSNPNVSPKLRTAVADVPEASRKAFENFADTKLPITMNDRTAELDDVQKAAEGAIEVMRQKARGAYGNAVPAGLNDSSYSPNYVRALQRTLLREAQDTSKYTPSSGGGEALIKFANEAFTDPTTGKLITKKGQINALYKELNQLALRDDYKSLPVKDIKRILKDYTPEYQPARDAYSDILVNDVQRTQKGLTGDIARMGGGSRPDRVTAKDTAMAMVFPKDKPQPQRIKELAKDMGPEGVGVLLRENLAREMQKAGTLKETSEAVRSPFRFVQAVAGTNAQRQNLNSALEVHATANGVDPAKLKGSFYKLMEAFESTKDLRLPAQLDSSSLAHQAGFNVPGAAIALHSRLGRSLWEKATARTYNKIADMVLAPDGLKQLEALANQPKPERFRAFAITVLNQSLQAEEDVSGTK